MWKTGASTGEELPSVPVTQPLSLRFGDGRALVDGASRFELSAPAGLEVGSERDEVALNDLDFGEEQSEEPGVRSEVAPLPEAKRSFWFTMMKQVPAGRWPAGMNPVVVQDEHQAVDEEP